MMSRVEAAVPNLQRYLQDEIGPADAADSVATLMAQPPDVGMQQVGNWAVEQNRVHAAPIADLLLLAMKKFYLIGELNLLDREAVAGYLDRVTTIALRLCPVDDRSTLRTNVTMMRMSRDITATRASPS